MEGIRVAVPADAPEIARIHIRTWQTAYRGQLPDDLLEAMTGQLERRTAFWREHISTGASARGQTVLVAEEKGDVVGFATCGPSEDEPRDPTTGELYAIYVDPEHWDHGHGRDLFGKAREVLARAGFREAMLWVLTSNARARRFYEIAGWRADGGTKTDHRGEVELSEVRYRTSDLSAGDGTPP